MQDRNFCEIGISGIFLFRGFVVFVVCALSLFSICSDLRGWFWLFCGFGVCVDLILICLMFELLVSWVINFGVSLLEWFRWVCGLGFTLVSI